MKAEKNAPAAAAETTAAAGMAVTVEAGVVDPATESPPPEASGAELPAKGRYDGITSFSYVGPSVPGGRLKANIVLNGTYAEIAEFYKEVLDEYPAAATLIVPVTNLAEARSKTERPGNILHKHYTDLVSAFKTKQRREE